MRSFPFLTSGQSLIALRVSVAFIFLAHAIVRVLVKGSLQSFADSMDARGFVYGTAIVWAITVFEIIGGIALALGYYTKWLSAGFIILLLAGILIIHASLGWFVGEHGTGGCEYSFILIMALLVIASQDKAHSTE